MVPLQKPTRLEQCQTTTEAIDNQRSNRSTSEGLKIIRSHATRGAQHYPFQARSSHSATQEGQGKAETELTTQIVQTLDWHLDNDLEEILRLTAPDIEEGPRDQLKKMISKYRDLFALRDAELGTTDLVEHHIVTTDSKPIKLPAHRIAPAKLYIVEEEVSSMLEGGAHPTVKQPL